MANIAQCSNWLAPVTPRGLCVYSSLSLEAVLSFPDLLILSGLL